jgi:hypothetical protein
MEQEKTRFPWKWTIAVIAAVGIFCVVMAAWPNIKAKYYASKLGSSEPLENSV